MDSRRSKSLCFVSHAHSDHLGPHSQAICTAETAALAEGRTTFQSATLLTFHQLFSVDSNTTVRLLSAGHVLGSAMILVERPEGRLLYTGDFKLRPSLTVPATDVVEADMLVMESTFGKPIFRFPPREQIVAELIDRVTTAISIGRQPIVMGYSLGKAQEIVRILTAAGLPVTCHDDVAAINRIYERHGVALGDWRDYHAADFHGPGALDLAERGVIVSPPQGSRGEFVTRFGQPLRIMMSGWGIQPGAQYRYGVDHVLPLSDHADFDELLEMIERVRPKKIFTHHGFAEFPEILRARGLDARLAKPSKQLLLFD